MALSGSARVGSENPTNTHCVLLQLQRVPHRGLGLPHRGCRFDGLTDLKTRLNTHTYNYTYTPTPTPTPKLGNLAKHGYRVVRPQPRPPDLLSFVGTASKSGAVPPIKENRMQGHNGLNEINAPTKDNTPTRLKLS